MSKEQAYQCVKCGKTVKVTSGEPEISDCCGEPVKVVDLPFCTTAPSAEHARATMRMSRAMTDVRGMLE